MLDFLQKLAHVHAFDFRGVAQPGSALRSGRRGRWFESSHPDQPSPRLRLARQNSDSSLDWAMGLEGDWMRTSEASWFDVAPQERMLRKSEAERGSTPKYGDRAYPFPPPTLQIPWASIPRAELNLVDRF
jgi:hypothetical protein